MMPPMTRREYELLTESLRMLADIERSSGNTLNAALVEMLRREVERRPLRGVA